MDPTLEYLWAVGYDLPPAKPQPVPQSATVAAPRRGKKAAAAKRRKAKP